METAMRLGQLNSVDNIVPLNERWTESPHTNDNPRELAADKNYLYAVPDMVRKSDVCRQEVESIRELSGRLIHAQEEERSRIARELHDDINQQLALIGIKIQRLMQDLPKTDASVHARLEEIWEKTHDASQDVQRISHRLHSSKLQLLGLVVALRGLFQEFTLQYQIAGETQFGDVPTVVESEVSLTLFRVAQEVLRNAGKHSQAKNIRMELTAETGGLLLRITDDGVGFDVGEKPNFGLGMISMEERLRLVNGRLSIWSRRGLGTQVEARIPLTS
jgi:signal transduction histidine kinase